jgi:hypothetical protein
MSNIEMVLDHDTWNYSPPSNPRSSVIEIGDVHDVIPFHGKRNPLRQSATSHRSAMVYRVPANDGKEKVGLFESAAELAVAHELLISPNLYDLDCQPMTVSFKNADGASCEYTHDLLATFRNGMSRLLFVRNGTSLARHETWDHIRRVEAASKAMGVNQLAVVNADHYTRQRRENLFRMHAMVFQPDEEADEIVANTAKRHRSLWQVEDLVKPAGLEAQRVFRSVYRLVARGVLVADLDKVLWEHSKIAVAA